MEDTKLVVCRLCLGFTTSDDSQIVDSPLKKILQDILPEINLEISYDPKICQPCNKSVLKCYEFKSSCSRDSIKEEIQAEEAAADLVIETDLQQEKKCDFCFSKINEKAFVEFSVRKEFFNEVLQKCLPGWFQKITKQKSAVPCGTCLDDLKSHFLFIGACLTTEEKIRKYCTTYGTNSKDKVNLFEVAQADLNPIQEYSAESKMGETIVPLKVEPIDIKHEIYEGDFIGHASTNQSDQLTASDGADDLAMVTDDQGPEKCEIMGSEIHTSSSSMECDKDPGTSHLISKNAERCRRYRERKMNIEDHCVEISKPNTSQLISKNAIRCRRYRARKKNMLESDCITIPKPKCSTVAAKRWHNNSFEDNALDNNEVEPHIEESM